MVQFFTTSELLVPQRSSEVVTKVNTRVINIVPLTGVFNNAHHQVLTFLPGARAVKQDITQTILCFG